MFTTQRSIYFSTCSVPFLKTGIGGVNVECIGRNSSRLMRSTLLAAAVLGRDRSTYTIQHPWNLLPRGPRNGSGISALADGGGKNRAEAARQWRKKGGGGIINAARRKIDSEAGS